MVVVKANVSEFGGAGYPYLLTIGQRLEMDD